MTKFAKIAAVAVGIVLTGSPAFADANGFRDGPTVHYDHSRTFNDNRNVDGRFADRRRGTFSDNRYYHFDHSKTINFNGNGSISIGPEVLGDD